MVHWSSILSLCGTAFVATAAAFKESNVVPGAYIVEFEADHDVNSFYNALGSHDVAADPRMKLDYKLFKGASFQLKDSSVADVDAAAKQIAGMSSVKNIWPVRRIQLPDDIVHFTGNDHIQAQEVISKRQTTNATDTFSTHVTTQVDKLRAKGITGKGIKIGVIDTGVDYNHPALGRGFGPGFLVSYGTDLVGDDYDGLNTPVPDKDPLDECSGHGTHVSGIIAAQANPFGFTGAAPDVTLGVYRVFGCAENSSATDDVLISAYNLAYEDGSDIITASIGGSSGWTEEAWAVAVQRIVEAGVPCTLSAGNSGQEGLFYTSAAAEGKGVIAVASINNYYAPELLINASYSTQNGSTGVFGWTSGTPSNWGNISLPLWSASYNTSNPANGCDAFPKDTPDLSQYIVLIQSGTCTSDTKASNAAVYGARYIMFYNDDLGTTITRTIVGDIQGVGMVTADQGVEWINTLAQNITVTVSIVDPKASTVFLKNEVNTVSPGFLSTYTSWGPTYEVDLKPQVAAPGGLILSTWPVALGSYAVISGTSMACPLTAAIVAMVAQVRGTFDPKIIENAISSTAKPNLFHDGVKPYPYLAPVAQQGAGLVQAYDAAYAKTLLSVSSLSFNDTDHLVTSANFTITNTGSEEVTYSLSNIGAATGYTRYPDSIYPSFFPNELTTDYATIAFSEDKVTIPAGGRAIVSVSPTIPAGLTASRLPVYGGYIALNATNGESLSFPYIGVAGSLHNASVLDPYYTYLSQSNDSSTSPVPANTTFVLSPTNDTQNANEPLVSINFVLGTAHIRVDVVPQGPSNATEVLGVKTLGNILGFPGDYFPRDYVTLNWNGTLEDGTLVPEGSYKLLVRALRIFGDRTNSKDYDADETVGFNIKYT